MSSTKKFQSCVYYCDLMHRRVRPRKHQFSYRCPFFCIDLDEVETLHHQLPLFSHNRFNVYSLRDSDHFREGAQSIRGNVEAYLKSQNITTPVGRIQLLTNLRTWGHVFNPVSFFFVYDGDEELLCSLAEVGNTFNEQKLYLLNRKESPTRLKEEQEKHFYVSPFSALDTSFVFNLKTPDDTLSVSINEKDEDGLFFFSSLKGERKELTGARLLYYTLRFPFITLSILAAIHWQALRLKLKKIPFFRKKENPQLQTGVRTYLEKS